MAKTVASAIGIVVMGIVVWAALDTIGLVADMVGASFVEGRGSAVGVVRHRFGLHQGAK